jgi:hypothetical protein
MNFIESSTCGVTMSGMSVPGLGKKQPRLRRDWSLAREKVEREGTCRACGAVGHLEAAHVIGRQHDFDLGSANSRNVLVVPDRIIPLCRACHEKQHRNELEVVPLLSRAEQVQAVADVGLEGAMQRLSPGYNPRRIDVAVADSAAPVDRFLEDEMGR